MHPQNQEHIEAAQQEADTKREALTERQGREFKDKLKIFEKCSKELTSAGIPYFSFVTIGETCFQYNNYSELFNAFDEAGNLTEESVESRRINLTKYLKSFAWSCIFRGESPKSEEEAKEKLQYFCNDVLGVLKPEASE